MENSVTTELAGTRFGAIAFSEEDVLTLADGMIGFPHLKEFILLSHAPDSPFRWLQSVEESALAFLLVEPTAFVPEYFVEITEEQAQSMGITSETPTLVLTTASIPGGRPEEMTLNLAGPVLINLSTRTARQLVLEGDGYTIKHRVFPAEDQSAVRQAA